jgi:hypothetical protein
MLEEFEDTVNQRRYRQHNGQTRKDKSTNLYTDNQRLSNTNPLKPAVNAGASEGYAVPVPLVAPVVLL